MSEPAPMPSYWALAEEVTHLRGHLDKLKAENEELRKELAVNGPLFETLNDTNDRLLAENEKLRELVLEMVDWAYIWDGCDLEDQFADRMRELGVRV